MRIGGQHYRSIWSTEAGEVFVIDQTRLPHAFVPTPLKSVEDAALAIATMQVRGAPLIGITAAYGVCLAMAKDGSDASLAQAIERLSTTRPTAVNLSWALTMMEQSLLAVPPGKRRAVAYARAGQLAQEDVQRCAAMGEHGLALLHACWTNKQQRTAVQVLTHCNAGWLATVDWGTALAPIYRAHDTGVPVHVWIDETRPRNQGAQLTAFELGQHGVPHTVVTDNAGGYLMQNGLVDMCIVGTDRTTRGGDVCNKIGTYLKALAAHANNIPFYVCAPSPSIDWKIDDGLREIPIEQRSDNEVHYVWGTDEQEVYRAVRITPLGSPAHNPAFDVTPRHLVTALITERGICEASEMGLTSLFQDEVPPAKRHRM